MFRKIYLLCLVLLCLSVFSVRAQARDRIIVIDPGHGGENKGASFFNSYEKYSTLEVAKSMKSELEKYEGVQVFLTREDDVDITLEDRALFARNAKADLLISLHFNASENHELHGSEMWVTSKPGLYESSVKFARTESLMLEKYGIQKRGIYNRLNSSGEEYYGIIRTASKYNIPSVIVEHCYYDRPEDLQYFDSKEALENLGIIDAASVAYTYRLKSETLGLDFSKSTFRAIARPVAMDNFSGGDNISEYYVIPFGGEKLNSDFELKLNKLTDLRVEPKGEIISINERISPASNLELSLWENEQKQLRKKAVKTSENETVENETVTMDETETVDSLNRSVSYGGANIVLSSSQKVFLLISMLAGIAVCVCLYFFYGKTVKHEA